MPPPIPGRRSVHNRFSIANKVFKSIFFRYTMCTAPLTNKQIQGGISSSHHRHI